MWFCVFSFFFFAFPPPSFFFFPLKKIIPCHDNPGSGRRRIILLLRAKAEQVTSMMEVWSFTDFPTNCSSSKLYTIEVQPKENMSGWPTRLVVWIIPFSWTVEPACFDCSITHVELGPNWKRLIGHKKETVDLRSLVPWIGANVSRQHMSDFWNVLVPV